MGEAFLVGGVRTPVGRSGGVRAGARPDHVPGITRNPLGSSGSRLVVTLLGRREREGSRDGLATMCVGVGQGSSLTERAG